MTSVRYCFQADSDEYLVDRLLEDQRVQPTEFNVLNHGDCWTNNIMFQYDAFGRIKDTLFVDFQVSKYGSPANDLYYLILSSAHKDIKLKQFDYLIRFYYEHLIENLQLLQYHRPLPKLKNIHISLLRNGLVGKFSLSLPLYPSEMIVTVEYIIFIKFYGTFYYSLHGRFKSLTRGYVGNEW